MNWFSILKNELASKTGFSQLDFDNIVIEDETNCLKRLRELNAKVHKYTVDGQEKEVEGHFSFMTRYHYHKKGSGDLSNWVGKIPNTPEEINWVGNTVGTIEVYKEIPNIPEEIACALIEFIQGIKDYKYKKVIGSKQGEYHFSFHEHDYSEDSAYMLLYVGVGKMMYKIFFVNTLEEKDKFKEWLSSVV